MIAPPPPKHWIPPHGSAWLALALAVTLLCGLGIWQLERLKQKETLIAALDKAAHTPPSPFLPETEADLKAAGFARYSVTGEFLHHQEMHLAARYYQGKLGYHLLTPLRLTDGRVLLVNRGWVPAEKKAPASRPESLMPGQVTLTVMLRPDRDHNAFTPQHDLKDNIWFWRDLAAMRRATGLDLLPISADVVVEHPSAGSLPIPSDGTFPLRNDHLGYAITWFLLALVAALIFYLYHRRSTSA